MKSASELLSRAHVPERNDSCQTWREFRKKYHQYISKKENAPVYDKLNLFEVE